MTLEIKGEVKLFGPISDKMKQHITKTTPVLESEHKTQTDCRNKLDHSFIWSQVKRGNLIMMLEFSLELV